MDYEVFAGILNQAIFTDAKSKLITNIARYPERYIGLFRPTKPHVKLIQNLTQSHEIRFGDAFESLIDMYLNLNGFESMDKRFVTDDGKTLVVDQLFSDQNHIYFNEWESSNRRIYQTLQEQCNATIARLQSRQVNST